MYRFILSDLEVNRTVSIEMTKVPFNEIFGCLFQSLFRGKAPRLSQGDGTKDGLELKRNFLLVLHRYLYVHLSLVKDFMINF